MNILHIETSTKACSIALSNDRILLGSRHVDEGMNHSVVLAPAIEDLLKSNNLVPAQLNAISVSSGPGSYTGLRVGCSLAKAMAYALNIPLLAVPTLRALAQAGFKKFPEADVVMPMVDARRDEVFTAIYNKDLHELMPVSSLILGSYNWLELLTRNELIVICGDGAHKTNVHIINDSIVVASDIQCNAVHLINPAGDLVSRQNFSNPIQFVPFYLKPPNITVARKVL